MTRKGYRHVASVIASLRSKYGPDIPAMLLVHELADFFSDTNPAFDRSKFLKACGELITD